MALIDLVREPVQTVGLVRAVLLALVAFGVPVTAGQQDAIVGLVTALLTVIATLVADQIVRGMVTPVADPVLPVGTEVNQGDAEVVPAASEVDEIDDAYFAGDER